MVYAMSKLPVIIHQFGFCAMDIWSDFTGRIYVREEPGLQRDEACFI
jgi:hypothetical protein